MDKIVKTEKPWNSSSWVFCDINHLKSYDFNELSTEEVKKIARDFIYSMEQDIGHKMTDQEKIKYLLSARVKTKTERLKASLKNNSDSANGFSKFLLCWIDDNLEYHETNLKYKDEEKKQNNLSKVAFHNDLKTYGVKWIGNEEQLLKLYELLLDKKIIITKDASVSDFTNFFNHTFEKGRSFIWQAKFNLIPYLFQELRSNSFIASKDSNFHSAIENSLFFTKINGSSISGLKQAKDNYLNTKIGRPKEHKAIDTILSQIL